MYVYILCETYYGWFVFLLRFAATAQNRKKKIHETKIARLYDFTWDFQLCRFKNSIVRRMYVERVNNNNKTKITNAHLAREKYGYISGYSVALCTVSYGAVERQIDCQHFP